MDDKIEEYLRTLYPEYDKLVKREDSNIELKRAFIAENIDEIEKSYQELKKTEKNIEVNEKRQKEDNELIEENNKEESQDIDSIEEKENEDENTGTSETHDNLIDKEVLKKVIKEIKINKYFEILHPEYDELDEEDQYYVLDDKMLIRENIDAIDAYYLDCKMPGSGAEYFELTDKTIVETALELFNQQEKNLTPYDIEQFSNNVKYAEFRKAITNIKEIANEENQLENSKQEE